MDNSTITCRVLIIWLASLTVHTLANPITPPSPEIVSAWKLNSGNALLIFRHDGVYFQAQNNTSSPGMENGTFTWDEASNAFSAITLRDSNGKDGLSHPSGAATLAVTGNTLTYTIGGEPPSTFTRVTNTASAIVGSWYIPGKYVTLTFLADGTYYHTQQSNRAPQGYDGIESGTYSWNTVTGALVSNAQVDTNGDGGLSNPSPSFTATVSGNQMTLFDGVKSYQLRRVTPILSPLNTQNDFEVEKFSNYRQSAAANPTLLPVPVPSGEDFPFWGEAYINGTVSGTSGTLTITGQTARPFIDDGGWGIATEYNTLNALNTSTAFPNNANYVFARTGGSATLSYPAGGTFPPAPKVTPSDPDDGTWTAGEYVLGQNQTLTWDAHTAYDPTTLVTVLSVVNQDNEEELLYETVIQGDITSFNFTGRISPGDKYDVQLEHIKIANSTTSGTGPFTGKLGYALYNSNTRFTMVVPRGAFYIPVISQQPASQLPANGAKVILTVGVTGENPNLTYQWFKNNQPIPGQTSNSLTIGNYSNALDGRTYTVKVSDQGASVISAPAALGPAVVEAVIVGKQIEYIQNGPTTVIVNPSPVGLNYGGPYEFSAQVLGQNVRLLAAPTLTPPAGTPNNPFAPFYNTLSFDSENFEWRYGPNANDSGLLSQIENDTRFPNGTYTFLVSGTSIPLALTGNAYPNTPQLTLSGGTWVNGKYAMDAANALTVTTNAFTGYSSNIDGHISLEVGDSSVESFKSGSPATNFGTYTVSSNTLSPYGVTEVSAEFDSIVSKSNALPGAYCAAFFSKSVELEVHFLPKIIGQSSDLLLLPASSENLEVTASGSPATAREGLNYQWKKDGISLPYGDFYRTHVSSDSANSAGTYTCTVSNDVGSATTQPIHLEYADAFQSFAASYGLNSVTTGAPDADFDKDGIPNLLEFILGGDPVMPDSHLLPILSTTPGPGGRNLIFSHKRKLAATGVTQVIESTPSLSTTWTPAVHGQNGVTITTTPVDPQTEQVTATIPLSGGKGFVRLKASR